MANVIIIGRLLNKILYDEMAEIQIGGLPGAANVPYHMEVVTPQFHDDMEHDKFLAERAAESGST
jgi:hypothetical protein